MRIGWGLLIRIWGGRGRVGRVQPRFRTIKLGHQRIGISVDRGHVDGISVRQLFELSHDSGAGIL
jgi:hypothetical protein